MSTEKDTKKRPHPTTETTAGIPTAKRQKPTIPVYRGNFKSKYLAKHAYLIRKHDPAVGLMVTCPSKQETRALGQARTFMDYIIDKYFPDVKPLWPKKWDQKDLEIDNEFVEEESCRGELPTNTQPVEPSNTASEKPATQSTSTDTTEQNEETKKDKLFQAYDTASQGTIFYRFRNTVDPVEFVDKIFEEVIECCDSQQKRKYQKSLEYCCRFLPMQQICPANLEDIKLSLESMLSTVKDKSMAIITQVCNNNNNITHKAVVDVVAPLIDSSCKVDLKNPDLVISVFVFKSCAGLSLLRDYYPRKKYNIQPFLATK